MTAPTDTRSRAASEFYPPITLTTAKCRPWCVRHALDLGDVMHYSDWLTLTTGGLDGDQLRICVEFIEAEGCGCRCGGCDCDNDDAGPYIVIEKLLPGWRDSPARWELISLTHDDSANVPATRAIALRILEACALAEVPHA